MSAPTAAPLRFHLSLNVADLGRSVKFFSLVFGAAPAKHRNDYAKFEIDAPPLVLSLEPHAPVAGGALNHAGFRFPDSAALVAAQRRLEVGGIPTQREEGVECCYARQTKFWARDPDNNLWEFYVLEGDIEHRGAGQALEVIAPPAAASPVARRDWEHYLGQPLRVPAGLEAGSLDQVRLRGSFNVPYAPAAAAEFLGEVQRILRPGGELQLHILTADGAVEGELKLPGAAAHVRHVPVREELLRLVESAGFEDLQLTVFRSQACFEHDGVPLRETRITCRRPWADCGATTTVVFKGPFAVATDDAGVTWRRGERVSIPTARWEALQESAIAELFVEVPEESVVGTCG